MFFRIRRSATLLNRARMARSPDDPGAGPMPRTDENQPAVRHIPNADQPITIRLIMCVSKCSVTCAGITRVHQSTSAGARSAACRGCPAVEPRRTGNCPGSVLRGRAALPAGPQDRRQRAEQALVQSAGICRDIGFRNGEGFAYTALGSMLRRTGEMARAEESTGSTDAAQAAWRRAMTMIDKTDATRTSMIRQRLERHQ